MCVLSQVWLFVIWWTIASQAPLSMGSPRWDYWSGLPLPPPKDLPDPGIELTSPELADEYPMDHQGHGLGQVWLLLTLQSCVCVLTSDTGEADGHCLRTALNRKTRKSKRVVVPSCSHPSVAKRTQLKLQVGCKIPILCIFSHTTPLLQAGLYHTFFF